MYCQKCRTPLKLDSSLEGLNPAAYDLLVGASSLQPFKKPQSSRPSLPQDQDRKALYDTVSKNAGPATFKRLNGTSPLRDAPAMSFILLSDSQLVPRNGQPQRSVLAKGTTQAPSASDGGTTLEESSPQAHEMERITKLFEILSARSDIDHPVCVECAEMLVDGLQNRLELATRERDAYVAYIKQVQNSAPTDEELRAQQEALGKAKAAEAAALEDLLELEKEKAELDKEILALEEESRQLDREEEQFWRERNTFATRLADFQNERDSINSRFDHDSRLLEKLQRSNVYNDTFCISHDGTFATINGLRLGRLSNNPVEWAEINAAWGHAMLLLVVVADKLRYRFEGYEPVPMGSTSKIIRYDIPHPVQSSPSASRLGNARGTGAPPQAPKKHVLELYSSGDMPLGLTFMHRRFDNAMVAFLELVRQLGAFVHRQTSAGDNPLSLPYPIEGDRIGDVSIKLGIAQDDSWTKSCKLTLTCCKFLLAHASNVSSVSNGNGRAAGA